MNEVTVKFFGPLRDLVGRDEVRLPVATQCTGSDVFDMLAREYQALRQWKEVVRLAVNYEYVDITHPVVEGDELCFVPPVSGG